MHCTGSNLSCLFPLLQCIGRDTTVLSFTLFVRDAKEVLQLCKYAYACTAALQHICRLHVTFPHISLDCLSHLLWGYRNPDEEDTAERIFKTISSCVPSESLRAMAQTMDARGLAPLHSAILHFQKAMKVLRNHRQSKENEMKSLQKKRKFGWSCWDAGNTVGTFSGNLSILGAS